MDAESVDDIGPARRVVDASGRLVTPGWVDIHTHYDGQASWDPFLTPSSWHGVTTVVMGNCGVGFAPAAPDRHEWLIELMEGVEDIPGIGADRGHHLGVGVLRGLPRRTRRPPVRDRRRRPGRPRSGPRLRDGRPGRRERGGDRRRHRGDGRDRRARAAGRCARLLDVAHPDPPIEVRRARPRHARRRATSCSASPTPSPAPATACSSSPPITPASPSTSGRGCASSPAAPGAP